MKLKSIILVALAMVLAAGLGIAANIKFGISRNSKPAFTLISRVTRIDPNNGAETVSQAVRYVSTNGNYHVINTEASGAVRESFFERGRGYFTVSHREKLLYQNKNVSPNGKDGLFLTAEELRSHPQFVRTEEVLGYTAYVLRVVDEATGLPSSDTYHAPELGSTPLKIVIYANGKVAYTSEPISIVWGEPSIILLKGPDYPTAQ